MTRAYPKHSVVVATGLTRLHLLVAVALLASPGCKGPQAGGQGINDRFKNSPDVANFKARWEGEDRDIFRQREPIVAACGVEPGSTVADIGAGTGAFVPLFSKAVGPEGTVIAEDITAEFLAHIDDRIKAEGLGNVRTLLGTETSTRLAPETVDLAFVCATYHHFEQYEQMLASIHQALRAGGRLVVIDFERIEGKSRDWILGHVRAGREKVIREITAAGFRLDAAATGPKLEENYFLMFDKQP